MPPAGLIFDRNWRTGIDFLCRHIAIDFPALYWSTSFGPYIGRTFGTGTTPAPDGKEVNLEESQWVKIAAREAQVIALCADGRWLYVSYETETEGGERQFPIARIDPHPIAGESPKVEELFIPPGEEADDYIRTIVVTLDHIYFGSAAGWLGRANIDGTGVERHWMKPGLFEALAVDNTHLYASRHISAGLNFKCALDGSSPEFSEGPDAAGLVVIENKLYTSSGQHLAVAPLVPFGGPSTDLLLSETWAHPPWDEELDTEAVSLVGPSSYSAGAGGFPEMGFFYWVNAWEGTIGRFSIPRLTVSTEGSGPQPQYGVVRKPLAYPHRERYVVR